jgi:hypothetical protein
MGEKRARREGILDGFVWGEVHCMKDCRLSITQNTIHLHSFYTDKLISVHYRFAGYNKCNSNFNLEATLITKNMNGDKTYD